MKRPVLTYGKGILGIIAKAEGHEHITYILPVQIIKELALFLEGKEKRSQSIPSIFLFYQI